MCIIGTTMYIYIMYGGAPPTSVCIMNNNICKRARLQTILSLRQFNARAFRMMNYFIKYYTFILIYNITRLMYTLQIIDESRYCTKLTQDTQKQLSHKVEKCRHILQTFGNKFQIYKFVNNRHLYITM